MKELYISQINNVEDLLSGDYTLELAKIQKKYRARFFKRFFK